MSIEFIKYQNDDAVRLTFSRYSAVIACGRGCNLTELKDTVRDLSFLHYPEPADTEEYAESPQRFGSAVLFPPNKLAGGKIIWNHHIYDLREHHIPGSHGLLKEFPFEMTESCENEEQVTARFCFHSTDSVYYSAFGWNFTCTFLFTLSGNGMTQQISFDNNGETEIPFGLGFHTAFRIPQNDSSDKDDYRIMVSCGKQWELDENGYPTGSLIPTDYNYLDRTVRPLAAPMAEHIQAASDASFHGARICNLKTGTELIYETDPAFTNWMIWNKKASDNFICIEPMTCIINAPNSGIPQHMHGFITLKPRQHWEAKNRLYVRN